MRPTGKIIFANQLRGLAALLVASAHLGCVFWSGRAMVSAYTGAPPIVGPPPAFASVIISKYVNFSVFGVALFFLISGFVIPLSLRKLDQAQFLSARFFRIYPTYVVSLLTGLGAVWLSCMYWGSPFVWDGSTVLKNLLLVKTIAHAPSIDMVNWTLAIEIKFYLVACALRGAIVRRTVWPLVLFAVAVFVVNQCFRNALGTELMLVSFMLLGVLFSYALHGFVHKPALVAGGAVIVVVFFLGWDASPWPLHFADVAPNYAYALAVFALAFAAREHVARSSVLEFFADISYPLYLTHTLVGYSLMRYLAGRGVALGEIAVIAAVVVIGVAYAIHRLVERPTMSLGKRLRVRPNVRVRPV